MHWIIDPALPTPIFEQLAQSVRTAIADGSLRPGDRLPAAKGLGESLGINVHTVLHAYQALRDEHYIELRRGRGAVVLEAPTADPRVFVDAVTAEAERRGIPLDTLTTLLKERLA